MTGNVRSEGTAMSSDPMKSPPSTVSRTPPQGAEGQISLDCKPSIELVSHNHCIVERRRKTSQLPERLAGKFAASTFGY